VPNRTTLAAISLAFAAFLFGATFVVVKDALDVLPPFGFVGWRFVIGAAVLLAISRPRSRRAATAGVIAGLWLFAGYACQTKGLVTTSASNSGLVTGLYVVFTPVFAAALRRRAPRPAVFAGAVIAFAGLAALTLSDGFAFRSGDLWTIACAVAFAGHIVYLSRVAHRFPVIALTGVQLAVTGVLVILSIILQAPLLDPANFNATPNPSKAPWYFLGLQEMVSWGRPIWGGVIAPGLIILGLLLIPYADRNKRGVGVWFAPERRLACTLFLIFSVAMTVVIVIGTFMRGPNWGFFWPWQQWPH